MNNTINSQLLPTDILKTVSSSSDKVSKGLIEEATEGYFKSISDMMNWIISMKAEERKLSTEKIEAAFTLSHSLLTMAEALILEPSNLSENKPGGGGFSVESLSGAIAVNNRKDSIISTSSDASSSLVYGTMESLAEDNVMKSIPSISLTSPNGTFNYGTNSPAVALPKKNGRHKHNLSEGGFSGIPGHVKESILAGQIINNTIIETIANAPFAPSINIETEHESQSMKIPSIPISPLVFEYKHSVEEFHSFRNRISLLHVEMITPRKDNAIFSELKYVSEKLSFWKVKSLMVDSMISASKDSIKYNITTLHPDQVAFQLTIIDRAILRRLTPEKDFFESCSSGKQLFTDFFNYITRVIEHSILAVHDPEARALRIHSWDKVASKLYDLRNFNSLKAVLSGLNTGPLRRLKKTWSLVSKKHMNSIEALQDIMSEQDNYEKYRKALASASRPAIPFLGVILYDITYLSAANEKRQLANSECTNAEPSTEQKKIHEILFQFEYFRDGCSYETDPKFGHCNHKQHLKDFSYFRKLDDFSDSYLCNPWFCCHWILTQSYYSDKYIMHLSLTLEPNTKSEESISSTARRRSIVEYFSSVGKAVSQNSIDSLAVVTRHASTEGVTKPQQDVEQTHKRSKSEFPIAQSNQEQQSKAKSAFFHK